MPAFAPQPQTITAFWLLLISRPAEGRMLSWPGWLVSGCIPRWFARANPKTVTHPSTNRLRRKVTSLMRRTLLPLRQIHSSFQVPFGDQQLVSVDLYLKSM